MLTKDHPEVRVRVFDRPVVTNSTQPMGPPDGDIVVEGALRSEYITTGGMNLSGGPAKLQHDNRNPKGAIFFVCPIDYSGLCEGFPRAHYPSLVILHEFDWETREGKYIHIPYGGRVEIEAI